MKFIQTGYLYHRNRNIGYSGYNIFTEIFVPEQIGLKIPIYAGRFFIIHPFRGMVNNKFFGSMITVNGDKFSIMLDEAYLLNWNDIKHLCLLCTEGMDYKYFLRPEDRNFNIKVMFLEPEEIFLVPKHEEYFYDYPQNLYDKITIRDGYYSLARENEEYIGYYVGYSENYDCIAIKLRP